jgi:MFS family permease
VPDSSEAQLPARERWLNRGVGGVGAASALSDLGHEIPTSLLPAFLTSTLGAPAAALGLIEGVADGLAGAAKLVGGAPADDPERRRQTVVGGYATTAVLSSAIGLATSAWQVGVLRTGAWVARGLRTPSRNALLADLVSPTAYGRAYGFERMMDNLGAIGGPLLALALVATVGIRTAILFSIVPGLLAVGAILIAVREAPRGERRPREPFRIRVRPVLRGRLGRLFVGVGAFEIGNVAATLLVLRVTELLEPSRGQDSAVQVAIALYAGYNIAATLASLPAGHWLDRTGPLRVLGAGVAAFALAYAGFAAAGASIVLLGLLFVLAGVGIGLVETSENAAVAALAPTEIRGSAFGLLGATQSFGNLAASGVAGLLWTLASPEAAFAYLAAWMVVALVGLLLARE